MDIKFKIDILNSLRTIAEDNIGIRNFFDNPTMWRFDEEFDDEDITVAIRGDEISFTGTRGASKGVLVPDNSDEFPWVLKFSLKEIYDEYDDDNDDDDFETYDYCRRECENYLYISEYYPELLKHFAHCEYLGKLGNTNIYIMRFYKISQEYNCTVSSKVLKKLGYNETYLRHNCISFNTDHGISYDCGSLSDLNDSPIFALLSVYETEQNYELLKLVIEELNINDLHTANFSISDEDDNIVFIDYSGFERGEW